MKYVLLFLLTLPVYAATSGVLPLKGRVPKFVSIDVAARPMATTLPLANTQSNTAVADITVRWNTLNGVTVQVSSANQGQLRHQSISSSAINYTLTAAGVGTFNLATPQSFTTAQTGPQNYMGVLGINYTGVNHQQLIEGQYSDTITFTVAAN